MKCIEANVPLGHTLQVRYLHRGNTSRSQRTRERQIRTKGVYHVISYVSPYIAQARLVDDTHTVVSTAESVCSVRDVPCRKLGRTIAVGRAIAQVNGRYNG